jgi:flagellar hook assembly protein FlgD
VARLDLYDVRGARVRTLVERAAEPGRFVVTWDGRNGDGRSVAAGVYLYRLTAGRAALGGRLVRLEP